jgi:hypothetical protein
LAEKQDTLGGKEIKMKITESKLRQIITEEYKKVIAINEVKQSSDYQRLVEIVGQEKADLVVEAFFDFDWIPGSAANKMRKVLNALEAAESEEEIQAIFDRLPDDEEEEVITTVANAARSSNDDAATDAAKDLEAVADNDPSTRPDDDQKDAAAPEDSEQGDPGEITSDEREALFFARTYADDLKAAGLPTSAAKAISRFIEDYLIDYFKARGITDTEKIFTLGKELKPEINIANANKLKPGEKFGKTTKDGKKIIYTITGNPKDGSIPVKTTQDGQETPKVALSINTIPNLQRLAEQIIKEELEKILKER